MVRRDPQKVGNRGIGADPVEKDAHLSLPALEVSAQHFGLVRVGQLCRLEGLHVPPHPEFAHTGDAEVAHPLRFASRSYEIVGTSEAEQVDRC